MRASRDRVPPRTSLQSSCQVSRRAEQLLPGSRTTTWVETTRPAPALGRRRGPLHVALGQALPPRPLSERPLQRNPFTVAACRGQAVLFGRSASGRYIDPSWSRPSGRDPRRPPFKSLHHPHSTFDIPHSTFPIPHSTFALPHSPFPIPHTTFAIPPSPFPIPHSPSHIPHTTFAIPHSPFPFLLAREWRRGYPALCSGRNSA
jgi:hypothetical protein